MEEKKTSPLYGNFERCDSPDAECFKCGSKEELYKDPYIEGLCFCKTCWEERLITQKLTEVGMDEEIPFDE
ncbi:MAG: hypothetical protein DSZ31_00870 [Gammaproteobacteria bacterium]|nr:MAG: hypothetical protein DSZ31_00870 [Gammaproteobacteria bacterium]RTZ70016.1 MAG: hypothetical protein DSZ30_01445 [Aquificaceae bacterium]